MSRCSIVDDIPGPSPSGGDGRGRGPGGMTPRWSRITGYGNRFASSSVAGDNCGDPCCEARATATATPIVSADTNITLIAILCGVPVNYHRRADPHHASDSEPETSLWLVRPKSCEKIGRRPLVAQAFRPASQPPGSPEG